MIINEYKGNLISAFLDSKDKRINSMAHGCNCFHTMGGGIASEVSARIPNALKADKATPYGDSSKLGKLSFWPEQSAKVQDNLGSFVFNLYTQFHPGPDARILAVRHAFALLDKVAHPDRIVGIPLIGCGIGGLQWEVVKNVINKSTPNLKIAVFHFN